ncbi:hypothetical protein [Schnuerera ultunensis]|uniref:Uncharacterized protein n=1 Tax=[Clostridium] ultunense Esp TaxID=1288971 RepID=A0A1M4PR94_9FIRM|nr:hypothetical protein [Schnuerera ultunensis]SHD78019.1 protein of unknown function [[Clostridium] ultunense Esp]
MAVVEEYILEVDRELRYLTSKTGSNYVYINSSDFTTMLSNFYYARHIRCMKISIRSFLMIPPNWEVIIRNIGDRIAKKVPNIKTI